MAFAAPLEGFEAVVEDLPLQSSEFVHGKIPAGTRGENGIVWSAKVGQKNFELQEGIGAWEREWAVVEKGYAQFRVYNYVQGRRGSNYLNPVWV